MEGGALWMVHLLPTQRSTWMIYEVLMKAQDVSTVSVNICLSVLCIAQFSERDFPEFPFTCVDPCLCQEDDSSGREEEGRPNPEHEQGTETILQTDTNVDRQSIRRQQGSRANLEESI